MQEGTVLVGISDYPGHPKVEPSYHVFSTVYIRRFIDTALTMDHGFLREIDEELPCMHKNPVGIILRSKITKAASIRFEKNTDIYGCFQKWWYPQVINFNRVFHYKPSILGYPYFWKHRHNPSSRKKRNPRVRYELVEFHFGHAGWTMVKLHEVCVVPR